MLPAVVKRVLLLALAVLTVSALVAGCGEEETLHVVEGEPLELGEVRYNVQITRFLNSGDTEDQSYLVGQDEASAGEAYMGVFLTVENEGDSEIQIPDGFKVVDTQGIEYEPVPSTSPFALELAGEDGLANLETLTGDASDLEPPAVPAGDEIPVPDSIPADGPIGGAMLLFLVDEQSNENRPLELEVPAAEGETGRIELDI